MDVNTTLLISLKQDIYMLSELVESIPKNIEDQQINSWFIPSKPYDFITKIVCSKKFKEASYQNCLELTLDRLYVAIRLIILHIDKIYFLQNSKTNYLIVPPSGVSVGYCVKLLWTRILENMEKKVPNKTTKPIDSQEYSDKEAQTDIISLNKCDSCSSAMLCMKNLLNFFEQTNNSTEGLKIKYKIFDITQFGCMMKVTSSIEDSLNMLLKQLHEKKRENEFLKLKNKKYEEELQDTNRKIAFFEEEVGVLRGKIGNDDREILILRQESCELKKENNTMKDEIKNLCQIRDNYNVTFTSVKMENNSLKMQNDSLKRNVDASIQLWSQYVPALIKKADVLDTEYDVINCIFEQYGKSINCLNIKITKISKYLEKIDFKIKYRYDCIEEILRDFSKYDGFCVKIKELFTDKLENIKKSNEKHCEVIKFKGNPIEDFTKQIEENKKKIKDLESENIKLKQLLLRFKNIKTG